MGLVARITLGASAGPAGFAAAALALHAILLVETRLGGGVISRRLLVAGAIARRGLYLELVEFVPFGIGAIAFRNGLQFPDATPRIKLGYDRRRRSNWSSRGWRRSRRGKVFVLQGVPDQSRKIRKWCAGMSCILAAIVCDG